MGLTIHYEVRVAKCDAAKAKALVRSMQRKARELARERKVEKVLPATSDLVELKRWAPLWLTRPDPSDPNTIRGIEVAPIEGRIFPVLIGKGCEPLWLGLCRYPATVRHEDHDVATGLGRGWRFRSACKTQYASLQGWEHFHRCHTTIVGLLHAWTELGATVRIVDEGGWWPRRSDANLRRKLDEMNGIMAGLAGAMKDASDDDRGPRIASPIFAHPNFEHLEADGAARHSHKIAEAARIVSAINRGGSKGSTPA
jgi:hypothetical protein